MPGFVAPSERENRLPGLPDKTPPLKHKGDDDRLCI